MRKRVIRGLIITIIIIRNNNNVDRRSDSLFEESGEKLSATGSRGKCRGPPERALGSRS